MSRNWEIVRSQIIGRRAALHTPFGPRTLTYADFTASGRGLRSVEQYMSHLLRTYANTHTEDDDTGSVTSRRLAEAEQIIKRHVHADDTHIIVTVGSGATGAINRLQEMLGIYIPPATRDRIDSVLTARIAEQMRERAPVVFVGPYEHHSNEISWREGICEVVEIDLDSRGHLDLQDLRRRLSDPAYAGREKIGSFSAASNVSGIKTDTYAVARIVHAAGGRVFFDFSASAPYVEIDMQRDGDAYYDGIFFSPHKYLGGPGSSGVLIVRREVYRADLPPSESGGGTVSYVNAQTQDYVADIEEREKPGTPGILQAIRAALSLDLQHHLGVDRIEARERDLMARALERFANHDGIEIMGDAPADERLAIFSFNVRTDRGYLHPRFVVRLMNDLFGIQARAGCSCAGPYGHRLLEIDITKSEIYRQFIREGRNGLKPGWVRVNFHYLIEEDEFEFVCRAIETVAEFGLYYLTLYRFDERGGGWTHATFEQTPEPLGIAAALRGDAEERDVEPDYNAYIDEAVARGESMKAEFTPECLSETEGSLIPFLYADVSP